MKKAYRKRYPNPTGGKQGCLCPDGTYSTKCCTGGFYEQGIGAMTGQSSDSLTQTDTTETYTDVSGLRALTCGDVSFSGFAVASDGTITLPTLNIGTIASSSPASFSSVTQATPRTLTVDITVPSGYTNTGSTITCTTTTIQQAPALPTLACGDVTISGFAVTYDGIITVPTVDIGTIASTSPASFDDVDVDTVQTLTVFITVPSGYANAGQSIECTTTATQPADAPTLSCSDITFTGLAVDLIGAVTTPSVDIGTVSSVSPTTFDAHVTTATSRSITVNVTVPAGYANAGATLACSKTVTQPAATEFRIKYSNTTIQYPVQYASKSSACSGGVISTANVTAGLTELFIHDGSNSVPTTTDKIYAKDPRTGGSATYVRTYMENVWEFGYTIARNTTGATTYVGAVLLPLVGDGFNDVDFVFVSGSNQGDNTESIDTCS